MSVPSIVKRVRVSFFVFLSLPDFYQTDHEGRSLKTAKTKICFCVLLVFDEKHIFDICMCDFVCGGAREGVTGGNDPRFFAA